MFGGDAPAYRTAPRFVIRGFYHNSWEDRRYVAQSFELRFPLLDYLRLGGDDRTAGDIQTFDASGDYTYRSPAGDLRTSFTRVRRTPEEGSATTSYRVTTLWTLPFRFIR